MRYPYLDEDLVRWALKLPVWEKCGFGQSAGEEGLEPRKKVLRLVAWRLGMRGVAREKKRAIQFRVIQFRVIQFRVIQFGARTAKMERERVRGRMG